MFCVRKTGKYTDVFTFAKSKTGQIKTEANNNNSRKSHLGVNRNKVTGLGKGLRLLRAYSEGENEYRKTWMKEAMKNK